MTEATNTSQEPKERAPIMLARIKKWLIPADEQSYLQMREIGIPLTILHQNFVAAMSMVGEKHGRKGKIIDFQKDVLDPFLERLGTQWNRKSGDAPGLYKCEVGPRSLVFESNDAQNAAKVRESMSKLEIVLERFFERWGYSWCATPSEKNGRFRLNVDYSFANGERPPIIGLVQDPEENQQFVLKLGRTRLTVSLDGFRSKSERITGAYAKDDKTQHTIGYVHLKIEISQGGKFVPFHTSRCTYSEVSNVLPMMRALMQVPNFNQNNFEVDPD